MWRAAVLLASVGTALGCTNILVTKSASTDGGTHIAYAADDGSLFGDLRHYPRANHTPGTMMKVWDWDSGVYLGEIPQASETYNVVGNMNEFGLAIGETTFGGLPQLSVQPQAKMDYGTLIWTALQRAKTAREAIHVMANITNQYGYYSSGETFSISDGSEVWVMDFIGKGKEHVGAVYVARKVPDGSICAHSNQARIRTWDQTDTENNIWAPDAISFARSLGLYNGTDAAFSFSDVYDPVTPTAARLSEARTYDIFSKTSNDPNFVEEYLSYAQGRNVTNRMPLFVTPKAKISVNDTMWLMRSHFDNTWFDESKDVGAGAFHARYRERPLQWMYNDKQYVNERTIAIQQTGWHFVAHTRTGYPDAMKSVLWFAVDDTSMSVHFPAYASATAVPQTWLRGPSGDATHFVFRSAFWIFNMVSNFAYWRWDPVFAYVQDKVVSVEASYFASLEAVDAVVKQHIANGDAQAAAAVMTQFTVTTGDDLVDMWMQFYGEVFVRFRDGFVTTQPPLAHPEDIPVPNCAEPGFDKAWRARIVNETGDHYHVEGSVNPDLDTNKLKYL
ncbi:putative dipeptidase [Diplonema papillatum]|nr:putative dipeptidase [Diplonema papillatum]